MLSGVPIVDLTAASAGDALVDALERASSAVIVGHGIDPALREEMIDRTRAFFHEPRERKALVRWPGDGVWRGWQPVYEGPEDIVGTRVPDLVERFEVHEIDSFQLWPDMAGFREVWEAYYRQCEALASELMRTLCGSLGLPEEDLPDWTDHQFANLVANHYPAQPEAPLPGQTRVGAHTDRGGITILGSDEAPGGLEVRLAGRTWVPVVIPPEGYVLQVGDLFAAWSGGRIRANIHRVVNPPREVAASASRLALVYFHYPALDTIVAPGLVCREHLLRRQESFKVRSDEVAIA